MPAEVIHGEWARMEDGTLDEDINPWGAAMFGTLRDVELGSCPRRKRPTANGSIRPRLARRLGSTASTARQGLMPSPLWIALFFISVVVLIYVLRVRRQR